MEDSNEQVFGDQRLRGSGIGSFAGGVLLGVLSLFLSFVIASAAVLFAGLVELYRERRRGTPAGSALGVIAVGAIGLLEALFQIIGISALLLAAFAIVAGLLDVFLGNFFGQLRERHS